MPPTPTKRFQLRPTGRCPLLFFVLLMLLASTPPSTAALFGRNNNKVVDDTPPPTGGDDEKDDAVANAKRLVDELNSAAMGTVTTYPSSNNHRGGGKEPATCDSIMAKSLVLANEEKAAVAAQLDSVVRAAGLLSRQIEDLSSSLDVANLEIAALGKELGDKSVEFEGGMEARETRAAEKVAELEQAMADARSEHAAAMKALEEGAERLLLVDREASKVKMAELEQALADARSEHATAMKALEEYAERSLLVEREASKVKMDALMNTTADTIAGIETKAEGRIAKLEKSLQDAEERHTFIVAEMRKDADGRMDSCMAKSDQDRESVMKHANAQIEAAKGKAMMEVELKEKEITDNHDQHQAEISDLVKKHAEIIEEMKGENERLRSEIEKMTTEAQNVQKSLRGDLELVRTTSFKLEKEVSFWKETHEQQGYCNTTLMKENSRRLFVNALDDASRGLNSGNEIIMAQLDTLQKTGMDAMLYIEMDLLPAVERIVAEARDKVVALYAKHLAGPVTKNLLPLYNERIYPVYNQNLLPAYVEHVSPVVRRIEGEAAVAIVKSQEGVRMARTKAAALVSETSNFVLEKNKEMKVLPSWLYGPLYKASLDGEWAVEKLNRVVMVLVIILTRSLIYRVIGFIFSLVWFFCPLRLLVGGRSKGNDAKEGKKKSTAKDITKADKSKTNGNGHAKVH